MILITYPVYAHETCMTFTDFFMYFRSTTVRADSAGVWKEVGQGGKASGDDIGQAFQH